MEKSQIVTLDGPEDSLSSAPFDGVFDTRTQREILEEMISDPFRQYTPSEISDLLGKQFRTLRESFSRLEKLDLIVKDDSDRQRPKYRINIDSHRILALSFYLLAKNDDKFKTQTMKTAMRKYCRKEFPDMFTLPNGTIVMERMIVVPENKGPFIRSEQTLTNERIIEVKT